MTSRESAMSEAHFSGINTRLIVEHLRDKMPPGTLETVLERAGETRSMDVLLDDTRWASYSQMRRLLVATGEAMGGSRSLAPVGRDATLLSTSVPEMIESVRALGSPAALYAASADGSDGGLVSIGTSGGWEIGPNEWMLTQQFFDGFEAIPEYCSLLAGLLAMPPRLFGYPPGEVIEEQCQADGAPACHFHVRWQETEDLGLRADTLRESGAGIGDASRRTPPDRRRHRLCQEHRLGAHPPLGNGGAHRRRARTRAGVARDADRSPQDLLARSRQ